jgi:hypothetical protein
MGKCWLSGGFQALFTVYALSSYYSNSFAVRVLQELAEPFATLGWALMPMGYPFNIQRRNAT